MAQAWDWLFYGEQRAAQRNSRIDEVAAKTLFRALDRVLEDGVFWTASQLFGIRFVERFDIPLYHPGCAGLGNL